MDNHGTDEHRAVWCSVCSSGVCTVDAREQRIRTIKVLALKPMSTEAQNARKPLPPDVLADALQDAVHKEVGETRPAKTARSLTAKLTVPNARFEGGK